MLAVRLTDPRMRTELYNFQRIMGPEINQLTTQPQCGLIGKSPETCESGIVKKLRYDCPDMQILAFRTVTGFDPSYVHGQISVVSCSVVSTLGLGRASNGRAPPSTTTSARSVFSKGVWAPLAGLTRYIPSSKHDYRRTIVISRLFPTTEH